MSDYDVRLQGRFDTINKMIEERDPKSLRQNTYVVYNGIMSRFEHIQSLMDSYAVVPSECTAFRKLVGKLLAAISKETPAEAVELYKWLLRALQKADMDDIIVLAYVNARKRSQEAMRDYLPEHILTAIRIMK